MTKSIILTTSQFLVEREQAARLADLEARERKVAEGEATYGERMDKANADFAAKRKKLEEENDVKVKLVRSSLHKDYEAKVLKQEKRFTEKRNELQARIKGLEAKERRMASHLQDAKDAKARAEEEAATLRQDLLRRR